MMKRAILVCIFAAALTTAPVVAHEGHPHKVMGTVCAAHATHLEIATTDGKNATVALTESTKISRGAAALKAADVRPGDRVVATATETKGKDGKTSLIASRIQLGVAGEPCVAGSREAATPAKSPR